MFSKLRMFWSKLCKSNWNCAWNLAFPIFILPIVWNMCENLHYESVYFKELHNEQEYYWPTIYRVGAAVVSTINSNNNNNSPGGYRSPWHHQEGHGKLLQQNPWQHQHTWTPENNSLFYSPPSQAGPPSSRNPICLPKSMVWTRTLKRKSIAITLVYL